MMRNCFCKKKTWYKDTHIPIFAQKHYPTFIELLHLVK